MALTHLPTNEPAAPSPQRWWLSLFPRLSAATKRSLLLLSLSAALLVSGQIQIANQQHSADSPHNLPAVQNALYQLGLPAHSTSRPSPTTNSTDHVSRITPHVSRITHHASRFTFRPSHFVLIY